MSLVSHENGQVSWAGIEVVMALFQLCEEEGFEPKLRNQHAFSLENMFGDFDVILDGDTLILEQSKTINFGFEDRKIVFKVVLSDPHSIEKFLDHARPKKRPPGNRKWPRDP